MTDENGLSFEMTASERGSSISDLASDSPDLASDSPPTSPPSPSEASGSPPDTESSYTASNTSLDDPSKLANVMLVEQEATLADETMVADDDEEEEEEGKNLFGKFEEISQTMPLVDDMPIVDVAPPPAPPPPAPPPAPPKTLKVFLRIRPMPSHVSPALPSTLKVISSTKVHTFPPAGSHGAANDANKKRHSDPKNPTVIETKEYTYSEIFPQQTLQEELYEGTTAPLVEGLFHPTNPRSALLFAYGITNAGKTHTIMGSEQEPGIVPRALKDIFTRVDKVNEEGGGKNAKNVKNCSVKMSYLEIYNEQIFDLMAPEVAVSKGRVAARR